MVISKPKNYYLTAPEGWFKNLLNQIQQATKPEHPNSIFFHINGEIYMEISDGDLWVSYDKIWSIFESRFGFNNKQIIDLVKGMVEEHTNLRGLTPFILHINLNLGGLTPVDKFFRCILGWKNIQT